jgi:RHS repeat-associated protein
VGNRLSSLNTPSYTYNSSNELTSNSNASYTYDANGNIVSKTNSAGTMSYAWNFDNRLTGVTLPGTGGTVSFEYDPFGRRIQKAFTQNGTTTTTNYVYDGDNLAEAADQNGNELAKYAQGEGIDQPVALSSGGAIYFYEADGLGSISSLTNSSGALANTYTYDSFGNVTASTGTVVNPFQFAGREFDPETGLYYYRARYYDPTAGRFLSEDPISVDGGLNVYRYAWNGPLGASDPFGLVPCPTDPKRNQKCGAVLPSNPITARLAQLVYAEGNGTQVGDLAIASVVVNRANYGNPAEFGSGILGAINKGFQATGNVLFQSIGNQSQISALGPANCQRYRNAALGAIAAQLLVERTQMLSFTSIHRYRHPLI